MARDGGTKFWNALYYKYVCIGAPSPLSIGIPPPSKRVKCPRVIMIYTYENIGVLISCIDQKLAIWLMQEIEGCAVGYNQS